MASPRAHGQAMISTDTAAVNASWASPVLASQKPSVAAATRMTTGTNTAETRSARRCTGALPDWASSTRRAIWASWVSAPIRVARTTSRPPALTVAPTTGSPGPTSTGTLSPVSSEVVDRRHAVLHDAVGGDLLARADHEPVAHGELVDRDAALAAVSVDDGDVLGSQLQQRPQGGARPAFGPGLEVAAGEQEHRHHRRHLQVEVLVRPAPGRR